VQGHKNAGWSYCPHYDIAVLLAVNDVFPEIYKTVKTLVTHVDTHEVMGADGIFAAAAGGFLAAEPGDGGDDEDDATLDRDDGDGDDDNDNDGVVPLVVTCDDPDAAAEEQRAHERIRNFVSRGKWSELYLVKGDLRACMASPVQTMDEICLFFYVCTLNGCVSNGGVPDTTKLQAEFNSVVPRLRRDHQMNLSLKTEPQIKDYFAKCVARFSGYHELMKQMQAKGTYEQLRSLRKKIAEPDASDAGGDPEKVRHVGGVGHQSRLPQARMNAASAGQDDAGVDVEDGDGDGDDGDGSEGGGSDGNDSNGGSSNPRPKKQQRRSAHFHCSKCNHDLTQQDIARSYLPYSWGPCDPRGYAHTRSRGGWEVTMCPFNNADLPTLPDTDCGSSAIADTVLEAAVAKLVLKGVARSAWPPLLKTYMERMKSRKRARKKQRNDASTAADEDA
jgi:hypothetical protein